MRKLTNQKGVALITALFIFSLVAIAAVAMADRQALDIRRTANILHYDKAFVYALNGEKFAQVAIAADTDPAFDSYGENDGQNFLTVPVAGDIEGGTITGFIRDVTAGFPINNMVDAKGDRKKEYFEAFDRFVNIVLSGNDCGNQGSFNPDLAAVMADWIDKDERAEAGGAEDLDYLNHDRRPYRTANQPIGNISELRALKNLIVEEYNCILGTGRKAPLINAIRDNALTINVNTAEPEVIQSIHPSIDDTILQSLLEERESKPFKKGADFSKKIVDEMNFDLNDPADQRAKRDLEEHLGKFEFSGGSNYFEAVITVEMDKNDKTGEARITLNMISLLKRDGNKVTTLQRRIGVI